MKGLPLAVVVALAAIVAGQEPVVSLASLVREARDLGHLAHYPEPEYSVVQWSSSDRRTLGPDSPDWFANADGFGGEPVPNVASVMEQPGPDGIGEYVLGEIAGPGAIVRTWSAGMNGAIRLFLDDALIWDGEAEDFLCARASSMCAACGVPADTARTLEQEDADYFPIPFARKLRIEWSGSLKGLHFYQIQIRRYPVRAIVRTFGFDDLQPALDEFAATAEVFAAGGPEVAPSGRRERREAIEIEAGAESSIEQLVADSAPGDAITQFRVKVDATGLDREGLARALRGTVLRIAFDGSQRPQVESPLGDFFGSGPGVNPFHSLPMTVDADGTMTCRFPMPFAKHCRIAFRNFTGTMAKLTCELTIDPFTFDERALHFRARWRTDRDLLAEGGAAPFDLPFALLRGRGRFVGCAVQIVNPSGIPTPGGNWWGEGDEKVFVDGEPLPTILGTGSEDFFNYAWSRPDLFAHPYCGQPLCSGPGTAGFVSNHRFQILDDVPFRQFFGLWMELWTHRRLEGVEYARIVWCYARPHALDDHVRIQPRDVELPQLPEREPVADGGARGASIHAAWAMDPEVADIKLGTTPEPLATRRKVVAWQARAGEVCQLAVPIAEPGVFDLNLVLMQQPGGALIEARVDGVAVAIDAQGELDLATDHVRQFRSFALTTPAIHAPVAILELVALRDGVVAIDYAWVKLRHAVIPGCIEGESMTVIAASEGLERLPQDLTGDHFSQGRHLWVKSLRIGDFITLQAAGLEPGRYHAQLRLTASWDYAILAIDAQGTRRVESVDTFSSRLRLADPVDLGRVDIGPDGTLVLRAEVTGHNPAATAPATYFGIDGLVLTKE